MLQSTPFKAVSNALRIFSETAPRCPVPLSFSEVCAWHSDDSPGERSRCIEACSKVSLDRSPVHGIRPRSVRELAARHNLEGIVIPLTKPSGPAEGFRVVVVSLRLLAYLACA